MALDPKDFDRVRELVLKRSGIVLDETKGYLVDARLTTLVRKLNLGTPEALMAKFADPAVQSAIVEAMTTNETSFFRDLHPFEALKTQVLPQLLASRGDQRKLTIWCAASSTGQEPYTLAILLKEHFPQLANWHLTFVASDLSTEVLEKAKTGRYSQLEMNRGLPAPLLVKYFKKVGLEWEVKPEVRAMIDFRKVNLLEAWPLLPPADLVLMRNVLIYFDIPTKKQIFARLRRVMQPDGFLFLGAAETTLNIDDAFVRSSWEKSGCYKLKAPALAKAA